MANPTESTRALYREYKPVIFFLLRFLGVYVLGNIIHGFWVASFGNSPDPYTAMVTENAAWVLRLLGFDSNTTVVMGMPKVALELSNHTVININEGCNAINVSILFLAFLVAYRGTWKRTIIFGLVGFVLIYLFNLIRIVGLFWVAEFRPDFLPFTHKYLFTGIIYAFVFGLWFIWIKWFAYKK